MDDLGEKLKNLNIPQDEEDLRKCKILKQKIGEKLLNSENFDKWFKEFGPFEQATNESVFKICEREFEEFAQRKSENESDLKYAAIEVVAKRCIQAKIHIENGDTSEALKFTVETSHLIKECIEKEYFSSVYANGFEYVVQCLEIAVDQQIEDAKLKKLGENLIKLEKYEKFSNFDRVAGLALKVYFVGNLRRDAYDTQIQIIKKMIDLDPNNLEWRCCLYSANKFKRNAVAINKNKSEPSAEEKRAIIDAYNLPEAKFDPRVRNGYAYCLAELVSYSSRQRSEVMSFGSKTFYGLSDAVKLIMDEVNEILAIDPMSVRSNIDIAKIFSAILPPRYQNKTFAKICIDRAILFHPGSSKVNHRMAVFLLKEKFDDSLTYFEKAFDTDERNYFAGMDLIKFYLQDVDKYRVKIQNLFDRLMDHPNYKNNAKEIATFLYLKAFFHFFSGTPETGIRILIESYKKNSKITDDFKNISYEKSRFKWQSDFFERKFRELLMKTLANTADSTEKQILTEFLRAFDGSKPSYERQGGGRKWEKTSGGRGSRGGAGSENFEDFFNRFFNQQRNKGNGYSNNDKQYEENQDKKTYKPATSADDWSILGIPKTATVAEIKKAYYKLCIEYHPDKNTHLPVKEREAKQEKMKFINCAYHKLCRG